MATYRDLVLPFRGMCATDHFAARVRYQRYSPCSSNSKPPFGWIPSSHVFSPFSHPPSSTAPVCHCGAGMDTWLDRSGFSGCLQPQPDSRFGSGSYGTMSLYDTFLSRREGQAENDAQRGQPPYAPGQGSREWDGERSWRGRDMQGPLQANPLLLPEILCGMPSQ